MSSANSTKHSFRTISTCSINKFTMRSSPVAKPYERDREPLTVDWDEVAARQEVMFLLY